MTRSASILAARADPESATWAAALTALGFTVEVTIDGADQPPLVDPRDADLLVIHDLCGHSPGGASGGGPRAGEVIAREARGRVVFRHLDLPWQRRELAALDGELPPRVAGALHAPISLRSSRELRARGYEPTTVIQGFVDLDARPGERGGTRAALGCGPDDLLIVQPTDAMERTNPAGAIRYLQELHRRFPRRALRFWLTGAVDPVYATTFARLLDRSPVPVHVGPPDHSATEGDPADGNPRADAFAAADVVIVPSTWESFGFAPLEAIVARRPCVTFAFPTLTELQACGLTFLSIDEPEELARFTTRDSERFHDTNLRRARISFDARLLPAALADAFAAAGWHELVGPAVDDDSGSDRRLGG